MAARWNRWDPRRSRSVAVAVALVTVGFVVFASQASGSPGAYRVLVVHDSSSTPTTLESSLRAFPDVSVVDDFDAGASTPTAVQLEAYDLVVSMSNNDYADRASLGDALADFVDSGGVAVQYAYDNWDGVNGTGHPTGPTGRFTTGGYPPFVPGIDDNRPNRTLGTFDQASPLMQGISSLTSLASNTTPTVAVGATLVADWNDAGPAIAVKGRVVSISAWLGDGVSWSGDFPRLTVNAVRWLGRHTLTVSTNGTGTGTITSTPAGIDCGTACSADFAYPQAVTLTATPASGSTFAGWSGAGCGGTTTCTVPVTAAQTETATFNAIPPPAPIPLPAPAVAAQVSGSFMTNTAFRASGSPELVTSAKRRPPVGTTIEFTLDKAAAVRLDFTQPGRGRKVNGNCVAQTKHNTREHKCTRTVIRGTLNLTGHAGQNSVRFFGWLSKHKKLRPGKYTLVITATTPGVGSTSRKLTFKIVN